MTTVAPPDSTQELRQQDVADVAEVVEEAEAEAEALEAGVEDLGSVFRPLAAAALASGAAGLMAGGVFGSWTARAIGLLASVLGVVWAWLTLKQRKRAILQAVAPLVALVLGIIALVPDSSPSDLPNLVSKAISSGRLLRPPVPFDPGWRPIVIVLYFMIGFAAAWIAAALKRPQLALGLPVFLLILTAISQPPDQQLLAALMGFIPILAALAVLFGGDLASASELTSQFELRRAVRGGVIAVPLVIAVVLLSQTSFLFPKPVYDPSERTQKPKPIPLSKIKDVVLFEVRPPEGFTGPWRTGQLDVYQENAWRAPAFLASKSKKVPPDGVVDTTRPATLTVGFTVRNIGDVQTFPGVATPSKISLKTPGVKVVFDPRTDTFRAPAGRVNKGTTYEISLPPYPTEEQYRAAPPVPAGKIDPLFTQVPPPPAAAAELLAKAPTSTAWDRLDFLRAQFINVAIAKGAGLPKDVPVSRVQRILAGDHLATPFEMVSSEVFFARWAGIPARVGFGFDSFQEEAGVFTVRPKNGSSWLEVYFEGLGWTPLISTPKQAQASLSSDPNQRFDEDITPSSDVAVEVYLPVELENIRLFYQLVRYWLAQVLPYILLALGLYFAWPSILRAARRSRRRRWAFALGPRAVIGVEYAEFRDMAMDLNVGDPTATPLEFLDLVQEDDEHAEFAWLVTRAMYGDMKFEATEADAHAAEAMSESLRRRLFRGQPGSNRMLAFISRASLRMPYTSEIPSIAQLRIPRLIPQRKPGKKRKSGRRGIRIPVLGRILPVGRGA